MKPTNYSETLNSPVGVDTLSRALDGMISPESGCLDKIASIGTLLPSTRREAASRKFIELCSWKNALEAVPDMPDLAVHITSDGWVLLLASGEKESRYIGAFNKSIVDKKWSGQATYDPLFKEINQKSLVDALNSLGISSVDKSQLIESASKVGYLPL